MLISETKMFRYITVIFLAAGIVQGLEDTDPDTRIVGGRNAANGEFPHQVSFRAENNGTEYHFCGGSIIAPKWILTAAHCTIKFKPEDITAVVGTNRLDSGGDRYKVIMIKNHEKFNKTSLADDIAVVGLEKEIKYGAKVGEIPLASKNTPGEEYLVISGWGYVHNHQSQPNKLQKLTVESLPVEYCHGALEKYARNYPITEKQICTYRDGHRGICQGDSGGPLIDNGELAGIASWYIPCARRRPDVFTRVFSYLDWINKNMSE